MRMSRLGIRQIDYDWLWHQRPGPSFKMCSFSCEDCAHHPAIARVQTALDRIKKYLGTKRTLPVVTHLVKNLRTVWKQLHNSMGGCEKSSLTMKVFHIMEMDNGFIGLYFKQGWIIFFFNIALFFVAINSCVCAKKEKGIRLMKPESAWWCKRCLTYFRPAPYSSSVHQEIPTSLLLFTVY